MKAPRAKVAVRAIDGAMTAGRTDKATIREFWMECVKRHDRANPDTRIPLYLTLPGIKATDVLMLKELGILVTTESGAVAASHSHRVIGIESSASVFVEIQNKVPGLKLLRGTVDSHLRGHTMTRFPEGEPETLFRAKVINLDLNEPWTTKVVDGQAFIPVLRTIQKIAEIHARAPRSEWTLCLTLHGECPWNVEQANLMKRAVVDSAQIADGALQSFISAELYSAIEHQDFTSFAELDRGNQQRFLLCVVPVMIANECTVQGWNIEVTHAFAYGTPPSAPMVTWLLNFTPRTQQNNFAHAAAQKAAIESLAHCGGAVDANGAAVLFGPKIEAVAT